MCWRWRCAEQLRRRVYSCVFVLCHSSRKRGPDSLLLRSDCSIHDSQQFFWRRNASESSLCFLACCYLSLSVRRQRSQHDVWRRHTLLCLKACLPFGWLGCLRAAPTMWCRRFSLLWTPRARHLCGGGHGRGGVRHIVRRNTGRTRRPLHLRVDGRVVAPEPRPSGVVLAVERPRDRTLGLLLERARLRGRVAAQRRRCLSVLAPHRLELQGSSRRRRRP